MNFSKKLKENIKKELRCRKPLIDVNDNFEFLKQFEYRYTIKAFIDGDLYYKTESVDEKFEDVVYPLDFDIDLKKQTIKVRTNKVFEKFYLHMKSRERKIESGEKKVEENKDIDEIKKLLKIPFPCETTQEVADSYLFNKFSYKIQVDDLTQDENLFMHYNYGGNNYLKHTDNIEKGFVYDINSQHPFIMSNIFFPVRAGESRSLKDINEIDKSKLGIYLLTIEEFGESIKYYKPMKEQLFYPITSYMLPLLDKTNSKYKMYNPENEESFINCIEYNIDLDCVSGEKLFKEDFEALYKIKKTNKIANDFLHMIMGRMSKKIDTIEAKTPEEEKLCKPGTPFYHIFNNFRIKPFVYDMCRVDMFDKYIKRAIKDDNIIYRIKSDSIIFCKPIKDKFIGSELGKMKFVGYFNNSSFKNVLDVSYEQFLKKD